MTRAAVSAMFEAFMQQVGPFGLPEVNRWQQIAAGAEGSEDMRAWMQAREGSTVETFQYSHLNGSVWQPGARRIAAGRATYVTLSGSRRDYAGLRTLGSNSETLIVADDTHIIVYTLSDR